MKLLLVVILLVGNSLAYPLDKEEVPLVITDYSSVAEAQAQIQDKPVPVHNHDSAESNESSESVESSEIKKPEQIKLETKSIEASSSSEEAKPNLEDKPIAEKLEKPQKEEKELKPVDEPLKVVEDNKVIEEIKLAELPVEPAPIVKNIVPEIANVEEPVKVDELVKLDKPNLEPKVKALPEPLKPVELPAEPEKIETPLALPTIKAEELIVPVPAPILPIADIPEKLESLPEALPSEKKIDTVIAEEKLPEVKSLEPIVPQVEINPEIKIEEKHESLIEKRADINLPEEIKPLLKAEIVEEKLQENTAEELLKPEIVEDKKKAKADESLVKEEIALVAADPVLPIVEEKLSEPIPQVNPEIKLEDPVSVVVPEEPAVLAKDVVAALADLKPEEKELKPEIKELQPEVNEQRIEEPKLIAPAVEAVRDILPIKDETLLKPEEPKPEILPDATQSS